MVGGLGRVANIGLGRVAKMGLGRVANIELGRVAKGGLGREGSLDAMKPADMDDEAQGVTECPGIVVSSPKIHDDAGDFGAPRNPLGHRCPS